LSRARNLALATVASLALLGGMLSPIAAQAATVAEAEPNNTTAAAQSVSWGSTVNAGFRTTGDCDNDFYDCDYYRLTAAQQGRLGLDLRFADNLGTSSSFDLKVLNSAGAIVYTLSISSSDYSGAALRDLAMFVDSGTYYVWLKARVSGFGSGYIWSGKPYTFTPSLTPGVAETEPNGTTATADTLALGTTISGSMLSKDCSPWDCDYFRVPLTSAAKVTVDFQFVCNLGTSQIYEFHTYDNAGTRLTRNYLTGADCKGATVRKTTISAPAGNFYVLVKALPTGVAMGKLYTLKVSSSLTATPTPKISGTAKVGSTLTAAAGAWKPTPVPVTYQWLRSGTAISNATSSTYTLAAADKGKKISVRVTSAKAGYATVSKTSASTAAVRAGTLVAQPATIAGDSKRVGGTLTAISGIWAPGPIALSYQWYRGGKAITGAKSLTYLLTSKDLGKKITVKITGTKAGYTTVAKVSKATAKIARGVLATSTPTISGTPVVGSTLSSLYGSWGPAPVTMSYQWFRGTKAISGAKKGTYTIIAADAGKLITVRITGAKAGYTTASTTSAPVTPTAQ